MKANIRALTCESCEKDLHRKKIENNRRCLFITCVNRLCKNYNKNYNFPLGFPEINLEPVEPERTVSEELRDFLMDNASSLEAQKIGILAWNEATRQAEGRAQVEREESLKTLTSKTWQLANIKNVVAECRERLNVESV